MTRKEPIILVRNVIFLAVLFFASFSSASAVDIGGISKDIDALNADQELSSERKEAAIALLGDAKQMLEQQQSRAQTLKAFTLVATSAQDSIKELAVDLETTQKKPKTVLPQAVSTEFIESRLDTLQADRESQEASLRALLSQESELVVRANAISDELTLVRNEVSVLESKPIADVGSDPIAPNPVAPNLIAPNLIARAARTHYEAQLSERRSAVDDLIAERATLPDRQELLAARIADLNARLTYLDAEIEPLQERLGKSRILEASDRVSEVEKTLLKAFATQGLKRLATENEALAKRHLALVEQYTTLTGNSLGLQQDLSKVTAAGQTIEQVLSTGQLNDDTADLLRIVGSRLPNLQKLKEQIESSSESIISLRLNRILWQDRLRNLADSETSARQFLADFGELDPTTDVVQEAARLLNLRKELLLSLVNSSRETAELQSEQRKLYEDLHVRTAFQRGVLQRRLLWLPTRVEYGEKLLAILSDNAIWLTSPNGWYDTAKAALKGYQVLNLASVFFGVIALCLFMMRVSFKRKLHRLSKLVGNVTRDNYVITPLAMLVSLGLAVPWPLLIGSLGFAIAVGAESTFSLSISKGFFAVAAGLFILNSFRTLAVQDGVFQSHFRWKDTACELLRFHLLWFTVVLILVLFAFTAALASDDLIIKYGIGRFAFIIGALSIALFAFYFLKPHSGIAATVSNKNRTTGLQKLLFVLFVLAPTIIGVMPLFGYFEAAIALQDKVFLSGIAFLIAGVIYSLGIRFFLISHRRLMFKRITEERQKKKAERKSDQILDQSGDASPKHLNDDVIDLEKISKESIKSLKVAVAILLLLGLAAIWKSMLPAFGIVDEIVLWEGTHYINNVAVVSDVSLWNLIVAISLIFGGVVVAANVRGFLELAVFERLNFDPGTRYAAVTITGYVLIGVGIVTGLSQLGVNWSSMQWVVAALGVGLGFGLQEIVANFVSGLIILFERPIRVGDIVTVGELEGTVTSIKIRATRITDFDNREVLMPNKSIITENVTNWTLTNQITRIKLQIGVAYGSDVDEVRDLIFKVVSSHPETLVEPAPAVFFLAHGDSSLNFEARVFVGSTAMRLPITHDLNRNINVALTEKGIEIPFPQRDLHIKSDS